MATQRTNDDVLGVDTQAPPPRRFFTPVSCCLGCAGLIVLCAIAFVGAGYYLYGKVLVDTPIAIEMPTIPGVDVASAREKAKGIADGTLKDATFSQNELNALFQDFLADTYAKALQVDPALCKGRVEFTADNQVKLALSIPTGTGRYLNLESQSTIVIENGEGRVSDAKYTRIGALDISEWVVGQFQQVGRQKADRFLSRVEGKLETFKVENGQAHVIFIVPPRIVPPEQPAQPEK